MKIWQVLEQLKKNISDRLIRNLAVQILSLREISEIYEHESAIERE